MGMPPNVSDVDLDQLGKALRKLRAVKTLTGVAFTAHKIGEFFREAAALVFIFVPLEIWDKSQGISHNPLLGKTLWGSLGFFCTGLVFDYGSALVYRYKKDLEGINGNS